MSGKNQEAFSKEASWALEQSYQDQREADHFLPVAKVPEPTPEQNLAFVTAYCAELKARLIRLQGKALEAQMWLTAGDMARATQAVNALIIDI